ncbi:MAG TPA: sugar phosphate isomerase/epimerase family protein [Chryseolinea sp.]
MLNLSRREFLKSSAGLTVLSLLGPDSFGLSAGKVQVCGHLWVYASRYPPNWDCTPILDQVFSDFRYAGIEGLEMMESNLRHPDVVPRVRELIDKYKLPVTGTSYSADMWKRNEHSKILDDITTVLERLHEIGGKTFGITVGNARRPKTGEELDAQAELLKQIIMVCEKFTVEPNIHNHTFEVENNMHDLKGIIERIPDIKLGPDLNWLIRGGVDPVWFIKTYGKQMVYMHIRDQNAEGKWTEAVGEGVTDFQSIAKALNDINYSGRAAIELAFEGSPKREVKESWKASREYVKKVFRW